MTLSRREWLQYTAGSVLAVAAPSLFAQDAASRLFREGIIIDGLGFPGGLSSDDNARLSQLELDHIRASGLTATHLTVGDVGGMAPLAAFEKIVRSIAQWEHEIDTHPAFLARVRSAADIPAAKQQGKTGLIYGLQDGVSFEDDLGRLDALHQIGVRIIQPTYNRRNLLGDGCMEPADAGLSRTGLQAIEKLNELNILIDLSHCGRRTTADAIAASKRPVSFTHTGMYTLAEHPRHRTDAEIKAVADTGGVIGVFIMPYLARGKQPTANDVVRHVEHVINVAGEDHVAMGTDGTISHTTLTPEYIENFRKSTRRRAELGIAAPYETETGYLFANDLNTPQRFETLADLLLARGYSEARVEKLLGANLLRLFNESWS
ncbi:MAG: dipeptidase [Xanthomonadales bacterium]|jgi:membrane dipeptidase|nr:dipeptidase [Xanthomonadales bacterium]MDH3923877.1 dipeptidase [Xanthomonadales bacterium]MDH3940337.1 dipeptidase [Xanthomonadales bacterium]MDH4001574.1 dipeptidase [Xanthomonadales bacterium]